MTKPSTNSPESHAPCVLTIGNFDGVHLGHQRIMAFARGVADECGLAVVAVTFDPQPDVVLRPADVPQRMTGPIRKAKLLEQAGADRVVTLRTDRALLEMSPEQFIDEIIVGKFKPSHIVEGHNFFFGQKRRGNVELLADAGKSRGFDVRVVEPFMLEIDGLSTRVSSTLIRGLLLSGRVEQANRCLGREFTLHGRVVHGQGRGRILEYPTANIEPDEQITPADGVYAGHASIRGQKHQAAISLGTNPTFGPAGRTVEAFLLNTHGDFYDESLIVSFVARIRDQERFTDAEALKKQIAKDVKRVQEICR